MCLKVSLVLGLLSVFTGRTTQMVTVIPICFDGDCYIKPENNGKSWTDAQQMCKKYNATLPVVDYPDRQRSLVAALYYFRLNGTADVWLGANASDYGSGNWRWLDGSQYSGSGAWTYDRSYAFLSKDSTGVFAVALAPYNVYSFICQYDTITADVCTDGTGRLAFVKESGCYVKYYDIKLSWFNARNKCLENNGDLASFIDISLLDGIVDTNGSWVGLRHSQWNWQNAVTGFSSDVKFTSWRSNQPDDATPSCISTTVGDFPNWKDWDCSQLSQYLCQVVNITWPTLAPSASTSVNPGGSGAISGGDGRNSSTNYPPFPANDYQVVAVGVGIGIPCALVIVALSVTIIVQQRKIRRNDAKFRQGDPQITDSKVNATFPDTSALPMAENDASVQYEQLKNRSEVQEQRQYEQLPQSQ